MRNWQADLNARASIWVGRCCSSCGSFRQAARMPPASRRRAARRELPGQKSRIVSDDDEPLGVGGWILVQILHDGVGGKLDVGKCKRVANDPAPPGRAKADDRHGAHYSGL